MRLLFEVFQPPLKVSWLLKRFRKTMPSALLSLAGLGQTLRVFLLKNSFKLENGVGLVNVAKTEPLNMSRKRKLNSCENEDRSGQNAKVSYQIKSW